MTGWAIKESRAPRINEDVQSIADKFFHDLRAEGKRAKASDCCELIRNMKDDKTGYYQFALTDCPSEKTLTSLFGNWESKRLRRKYLFHAFEL